MIFKHNLIVFVYILNIYYRGVSSKQEKLCHKLNVVLFFAKTSCNPPRDAPAVGVLEMHEVARVKHTFPVHLNYEVPGEVLPRSGPSCKELLRESLTSLVHYCQNALGMKTAVASVSNSEIADDINSSEPATPPEVRERHFSDTKNVPRDALQGQFDKKGAGIFAPQWVPRKPESVNLRDVITSPEHTEVFKIRVKRQLEEVGNEPPGDIVDVPLEKEGKKHPWDVLDIMSHVRFSFFGKLFEDTSKNKLNEEENRIAGELTQKKVDPGLFETVKTILNTLQENREEQLFMTIFGGHLSEISNANSPLVQSIKHVIENTDQKNTLIVLTGACPEHHRAREHKCEHGQGQEHELGHGHEVGRGHVPANELWQERGPGHVEDGHQHEVGQGHDAHKRGHDHQRKRRNECEQNVVRIDENANDRHRNGTIPVFARGPECSKLSQCSLLFDVPVVVKGILEEITPTFEGEPRPKRSIFGDIRMNKDNYENRAERLNQYLPVIFNLCVFVLFII